MNYLQKNFKYLRERAGLNQVQISTQLGFNRSTWNNYETGKSQPNLDDFITITKYFGFTASQILEMDLQNVNLIDNSADKKREGNVNLKVNPIVNLKQKKAQKEPCKECNEKDKFISVNLELLNSKTQLIEQLQANIKLLQNHIDQMEIQRQERHETQYTPRKGRKSA